MTLSSVKTFLIIALVTLLVWLLAESESLRIEKVPVRVTFLADPESGRLVRLEPNQDFNGTVSLRLEGSTAAVDSLATELRRETGLRLEPGNEGVPAEPGRHTVSLQTALRSLPHLRDSGVTIADAVPPTAIIVVDDLVTRDAKVKVEVPDGQALETAPEAAPATVKIRLPESASKTLADDLTLSARIDPSSLVNLQEGRRTTLAVPVSVPESLRGMEGVRVTPATVTVSLTLRSRTASTTLATVPVHLRLAPTEVGLWDIQIPEGSRQLTDVTVTGPSDIIDQIKSGALKPIAFIPLSFEELEKAAASGEPMDREPVFTSLPSQLRFEPKQKTVRLIVKRRETPSAPGTSKAPPS